MEGADKIGVFDSGYGGLTVFKEIVKTIPHYNYIYLGDNSRAPYGNKSFETVYLYTWQCVEWLIHQGCKLIIVACNTASARALRTIQSVNLKQYPSVRVLGVIRPTAEIIGTKTKSGVIGIVGTEGTIKSKAYLYEIEKFYPKLSVHQLACNLWVPIIESDHWHNDDVDLIIKNDLKKLFSFSDKIDTLLLGCTHYPLLIDSISKFIPEGIQIVSQGEIVAASLLDYLSRHIALEKNLGKDRQIDFYTTDDVASFEAKATDFYGRTIQAKHLSLEDK